MAFGLWLSSSLPRDFPARHSHDIINLLELPDVTEVFLLDIHLLKLFLSSDEVGDELVLKPFWYNCHNLLDFW